MKKVFNIARHFGETGYLGRSTNTAPRHLEDPKSSKVTPMLGLEMAGALGSLVMV